uniref:Nuclear egress lamina protein n=1 Tax=Cercopithecine herpesvirus 16 TaxID=340907 RepID=X2FKQ2_CHV16|nr:nuclear egress lamina protein [Papiine alphaherpesvirus 2]
MYDDGARERRASRLARDRRASRRARDDGLGVARPAGRRPARSRSSLRRLEPSVCERERYRGVFAALAQTPSEEIAVVRSLSVPLVRTTPVALPFDLERTVADNCLTLSGMGYYLGIGGCCPACGAGDGRLGATSREALILAFVQQINTIFEHRAFLASLAVLADRQHTPLQDLLAGVLGQPELFFVHTILRAGGAGDPRLLFYPDPTYGGHMLYVILPGTSAHLHYRLIDRMLTACPGYRFVAHVWQSTFVLVVRRGAERTTTDADVPAVSAADIYCKMRDINFDGGLMLEYQRLYAAFDEFPPP